jgi:hypothetical protein
VRSAEKIHALSPDGYVGALSSLKGYVAERVVAAELVMQGHDVSFPDASNQPGWDLMVDGHEFQIKCFEHVSGLSDHFERYNFPVIANAELAGEIPAEWADKVFFVEGYSDQLLDAHIHTQRYRDWTERAHESVDTMCQCLNSAVEEKLVRRRAKWQAFGGGGIRDYIRARLEAEAAFLKEAQARLGQVTRSNIPAAEQRAIEVIRWAAGSTVHPIDYQRELRTLQQVLSERPDLPDRPNEVGGIVKGKISGWYDDSTKWFHEKSSAAKPGRE